MNAPRYNPVEIRSYGIGGGGLYINDCILGRTERGGHRHMGRGRSRDRGGKDWSEVAMKQIRISGSHPKPGKCSKRSSLEPSNGAHPADALVSDSRPPEPQRNKFLLF